MEMENDLSTLLFLSNRSWAFHYNNNGHVFLKKIIYIYKGCLQSNIRFEMKKIKFFMNINWLCTFERHILLYITTLPYSYWSNQSTYRNGTQAYQFHVYRIMPSDHLTSCSCQFWVLHRATKHFFIVGKIWLSKYLKNNEEIIVKQRFSRIFLLTFTDRSWG